MSFQYDLSIRKEEDLISPIDIRYTSRSLFRLNLAIILLLLLSWTASLFLQRKTLLKVALGIWYTFLCVLWVITSCASINYFTNVQLNTESISKDLVASMSDYNNHRDIKLSWDKMQTLFQCCGTQNYTDWMAMNIPLSCIPEISEVSQTSLYKKACLAPFINYLDKEMKGKCVPGLILSILNVIIIIIMSFILMVATCAFFSLRCQRPIDRDVEFFRIVEELDQVTRLKERLDRVHPWRRSERQYEAMPRGCNFGFRKRKRQEDKTENKQTGLVEPLKVRCFDCKDIVIDSPSKMPEMDNILLCFACTKTTCIEKNIENLRGAQMEQEDKFIKDKPLLISCPLCKKCSLKHNDNINHSLVQGKFAIFSNDNGPSFYHLNIGTSRNGEIICLRYKIYIITGDVRFHFGPGMESASKSHKANFQLNEPLGILETFFINPTELQTNIVHSAIMGYAMNPEDL